LVLTPIWRATISLNNEPLRLQVLPPMSADVADKIMLLKVNRHAMPMPTDTAEEKERFWLALKAEMPHFLHFLQTWTIPVELRCPRFGIRHYHHPELLAALENTAPETRLLSLIDQIVFAEAHMHRVDAFEGTADSLERTLRQSQDYRHAVDPLLKFAGACGTYLGKLAARPNSRVTGRTIHGQNRWTIQPPPQNPEGGRVDQVSDKSVAEGGSCPLALPEKPTSSSSTWQQGGRVDHVCAKLVSEIDKVGVGEGTCSSPPKEVLGNMGHPSTLEAIPRSAMSPRVGSQRGGMAEVVTPGGSQLN